MRRSQKYVCGQVRIELTVDRIYAHRVFVLQRVWRTPCAHQSRGIEDDCPACFAWLNQDTAAIQLVGTSNTTSNPAYATHMIGGTEIMALYDDSLRPGTDSTIDLGTTGLRWSTAYIDAVVGLDWQTWTVTDTDFTIGNGTIVARYVQIGSTIIATMTITFGSTTTIDGSNPRFSFPVASNLTVPVGVGILNDPGNATYPALVRRWDADEFYFVAQNASGTYLTTAAVSATVPFTWATGDAFRATMVYEID